MVYRALPEAVQKDVDKEVAKGELASYESIMDFIRNQFRGARYQKQAAARPLTANIIEDNPGPMASTWQSESPRNNVYSVDEWSEWLHGDEGQQAIQDGVELPSSPEMHLALLAVAKGKGKWATKGTIAGPKVDRKEITRAKAFTKAAAKERVPMARALEEKDHVPATATNVVYQVTWRGIARRWNSFPTLAARQLQ